MNIFKAELDTIHQNGVIGPITQFDNATLELQILTGGQVGESWNSPEFELIAMKRDMNPVREVDQDKFTILSNEDHTVRIELKEQFLTCRGTVKMQLVIKDGSRTSTTIFYLSVGQSLDAAIIESLKDIKVLDDLDEVVELVSTFEVTATNNEATRQHNEKLREVAESNRQDEFDKAQNQRDTEFEGCQNERKQAFNQSQLDNQTTFNNNESKRQSDFNKAQTSNQQTFEFNESERQTSFERNEKERQDLFNENESERSKNEIKRVKDERTRQQFETQRQEDEAKRQQKMTEFEEKATQLSDDLDNQVARVDEFVSANEEKLLGPHDKTDYMGNAHNSVKDVMDANVEFVLDEVNTVHYEGQTITATDTIERQVRSAILKGCTLVNLATIANRFISHDGWNTLKVKLNYPLFANTKYLINVFNLPSNMNYVLTNRTSNSNWLMPKYTNEKTVFTSQYDSDFDIALHVNNGSAHALTQEEIDKIQVVILEYQEGMENWDIPYFEGMQSVRMPVLKTTGNNLWDGKWYKGFSNTGGGGELATLNDLKTAYRTDYIKIPKNSDRVYVHRFCEATNYTGTNIHFGFFDKNKQVLIVEGGLSPASWSVPTNAGYVVIHVWNSVPYDFTTLRVNVSTAPVNAKSYEPHKSNILSTPEDVELGSVGNVKDELNLVTGELTQRTDIRAYQEGDESNSEVLTDLTNTRYKLAKEVVKTVDLKGQKVYSYDGTTHYTCSAAEGSLVPTLSIDVPTNLPALVSRQRVTIESQKEQIITLEQENEQLIAQNEVQDTDIALNQDAINFMLFAPSVKSISEDKGGVSTMAAYLANQILKGRLDYTLVISRYGEFKEDIDTILIAEGKQDLIK